MKKLLILSLSIFLLTCFFYCTKNIAEAEKKDSIQKIGIPMILTVDVATVNELLDPGGGDDGDLCIQHGGTVGIGTSWQLATCRSNCQHGIGFRCGRETYVICQDGTHIPVSQSMGNCPVAVQVPNRQMNAVLSFYDNGTLKLTFAAPIPSSEVDNNTFEVEQDEYIDIPEYLRFNGVKYSKVKVQAGNYQLNRTDGNYGTVTLFCAYIE